MSEDDKPLYDIESYWELIYTGKDIFVHKHKQYDQLHRVLYFDKQEVRFVDKQRVPTKNIIDINKAIPEIRKSELIPLILGTIDAAKPISMPYAPEKLKVYIEDLTEYVGILYYMDSDEDKSIVPIKRFFKFDSRSLYQEVPFDEYQKYKEEHEDVNTNTEQAANS